MDLCNLLESMLANAEKNQSDIRYDLEKERRSVAELVRTKQVGPNHWQKGWRLENKLEGARILIEVLTEEVATERATKLASAGKTAP